MNGSRKRERAMIGEVSKKTVLIVSLPVSVVSLLRILLWTSLLPSSLSFASSFGVILSPSSFRTSFSTSVSLTSIAPELSFKRKEYAAKIIDRVFGKEDSRTWDKRREDARATTNDNDQNATTSLQLLQNIPEHELVYGELGIEALATILDAVGVHKGDVFLDIGSGDGLLVVGASLLFPGYLRAARGIEIVQELHQRSLKFQDKFCERLRDGGNDETEPREEEFPKVSFHLGNIYETGTNQNKQDGRGSSSFLDFSKVTLAVCFATTWSNNIPGKRLDRLSRVLGQGGCSELPIGAKLVIIDGVLEPSRDGYVYEGELKLHCPDTAPYSLARLYTRI